MTQQPDKLSELLQPDRIIELPAGDKDTLLRLMSDRLAEDPRVLDVERFYRSIVQRERLASTGVGMGVAVPHVKIAEVTDYIMAVGRCREGVDFDAIDREPVQLIFMIGASERQTREFVKILARVTRLIKSPVVRRELLEVEIPMQFLQTIQKYEV